MHHNVITYRDSDIFQKVFEESSNLQSYTCSLRCFQLTCPDMEMAVSLSSTRSPYGTMPMLPFKT